MSVVVKYCVSCFKWPSRLPLLILIKPKSLCSILRIVLPLLQASIGVTRSYSKWMMFWWHILSSCQMCNWCFQYQLCNTYRGLWGLVVVWLLWLSGRALAAQASSVLGLTFRCCWPFHSLFLSEFLYNKLPCNHGNYQLVIMHWPHNLVYFVMSCLQISPVRV